MIAGKRADRQRAIRFCASLRPHKRRDSRSSLAPSVSEFEHEPDPAPLRGYSRRGGPPWRRRPHIDVRRCRRCGESHDPSHDQRQRRRRGARQAGSGAALGGRYHPGADGGGRAHRQHHCDEPRVRRAEDDRHSRQQDADREFFRAAAIRAVPPRCARSATSSPAIRFRIRCR